MSPNSPSVLMDEFSRIGGFWRFILYRAYLARKMRVRRSLLGFAFEPILLVISTFFIALVWNKLFGRGGGREFTDFFVYVLTSFVCWNLISSIVSGLSGSLLGRLGAITESHDPVLMPILVDLCDSLFGFLLSLPLVLVAFLTLSELPAVGLAYLLYGIILVIFSGIGIGLTLGMACVFIGDLRAVVNAVMRVAFLLTPIIWQLERLGEYQKYIYWNPFYNYLAVCRDGLLKGHVGQLELLIATTTTITLFGAGLLTLKLFKTRLRVKAFQI